MAEPVVALATEADTKIVLVVLDGLGGIGTVGRGSELAEARTPNLDALAIEGSSGVHTPVAPGITPGSGAGHLALFGYDPLIYELGRGALSAAGVGFDLKPGDIAARVNFCALDPGGRVADRRAGRLSSDENQRLCRLLRSAIDLGEGIEVFLETEREHRALLVLRGEGLSPHLTDSDPGVNGEAPRPVSALRPEAEDTADLVNSLLSQARSRLEGESANFILLRGFDTLRELPSFSGRYRLRALGIAGYPMYIGISRILGFDVTQPQETFAGEVELLNKEFASYDFFFIHYKKTDSAGEDGDFDRKKLAIEEVDSLVPEIVSLRPDVICVTGDHSTPSQLKSHSWHPVPFVIWGPRVGADAAGRFDEQSAASGGFGHILGKDLMALMLAAAGRLMKFGA